MRLMIALGLTLAGAGVAAASPSHAAKTARPKALAPQPMAIDVASVPAACKSFVPAAGAGDRMWGLRISLANCMSERAMNVVTTHDAVLALHQLEAAAGPAVAMLDDVQDHGAPRDQVLAAGALGDLHSAIAVRARDAIPAMPATPTPADIDRYARAHLAIEPLVVPELTAARDAYTRVDKVVVRHLFATVGDPVVERVIAEASRALTVLPKPPARG